MNIALSDRRVSPRHNFKLPLRVRILKSAIAEQRTESENLSGEVSTSRQIRAARRYRRPSPFEDAGGDYRRAHKRMAVLGHVVASRHLIRQGQVGGRRSI